MLPLFSRKAAGSARRRRPSSGQVSVLCESLMAPHGPASQPPRQEHVKISIILRICLFSGQKFPYTSLRAHLSIVMLSALHNVLSNP
jgi:hypothetical protein